MVILIIVYMLGRKISIVILEQRRHLISFLFIFIHRILQQYLIHNLIFKKLMQQRKVLPSFFGQQIYFKKITLGIPIQVLETIMMMNRKSLY